MTTTPQLDLRTDLPKIRAAYDAQQLQAQKETKAITCTYQGPCAVGVCLPEARRTEFGNRSIRNIFDFGDIDAPKNQRLDWLLLQDAHDSWAHCWVGGRPEKEAHFVKRLTEMEAKYAQNPEA